MATATLIPIATQTLGSAAASITFSSIPGTYTDLKLVLTGTTANSTNICYQFNGDTGTNYSGTLLGGNGSSASSSNNTSQSEIFVAAIVNTSTTVPIMSSLDIMSYAGSTNKAVLFSNAIDLNGSGGVEGGCGLWRSTAAITSIKIFAFSGNLNTGCIATLWGI